MILETDGSVIAGKVASHNMDDGSPISEQVTNNSLYLLNHILDNIHSFGDLSSERTWGI